jgi:hypothetical protein
MIPFSFYWVFFCKIFFGVPNSKKLKTTIHAQMQNQEIKKLENLFLKFLTQNKNTILNWMEFDMKDL